MQAVARGLTIAFEALELADTLPFGSLLGHSVPKEHHVWLQVAPAGRAGRHVEAVSGISQLHIPVWPAHRPLDIPIRTSHCHSSLHKQQGLFNGDACSVGSDA